jgi:PAT family beta-lactamase induction signal transducer AmpG
MALAMAEFMEWSQVYKLMGLIMVLGPFFVLLAPATEGEKANNAPKNLKEAVIGPLKEYFQRGDAIVMLMFILFYKLGDSMAAHMSMPLYLDLGYQKLEIAKIAKGIGMVATITGGTLGGVMMIRLGVNKALWIFGGLQMISTAGFSVLASIPKSLIGLSTVIGVENLCSGMGTTAFVAFMASITNKKFTATQYALLTSLMGVPRVIGSAPTGWMVKTMGYPVFFIVCTIIAIPGLFLLARFAPFNDSEKSTLKIKGA